MNAELQARAHEAAARALDVWYRDPTDKRDRTKVVADAVLGVVADWCDEQRLLRPVYDADYGWNVAYEGVAEACRPVGPDMSNECGHVCGHVFRSVWDKYLRRNVRRCWMCHHTKPVGEEGP